MLAIFTNSFDVTTDLIIKHLDGKTKFFRFNSDLLSDYSITWEPGHWKITNVVTSDSLTSSNISTAYWRKPLEMLSEAIPGYPEPFYSSEIRYAFREIINSIIRSRKFRLVEPFAERRVGKFYQLEVALSYFPIPKTLFTLNPSASIDISQLLDTDNVAAKSISGVEVSIDNVMYTSRVDPSSIDLEKPWYLQGLIDGNDDVTCAFVAGKCFWSRRTREAMGDYLDVRECQGLVNDWEIYIASPLQESGVTSLMHDLSLDFGRLDFLENNGKLTFLEVNPNGQFAWLDEHNQRGLISQVIDVITQDE